MLDLIPSTGTEVRSEFEYQIADEAYVWAIRDKLSFDSFEDLYKAYWADLLDD